MSFDASLHALLARNCGTDRSLQFAVVPEGYDCAGEWGIRLTVIRGEEWKWLLEIEGVTSPCVNRLHETFMRNGFTSLCSRCPPEKKIRCTTETFWYWKAGYSPNSELIMDTPPRISAKLSQREQQKQLHCEQTRNRTLRRCLRASEEKRMREREVMEQRLLALQAEKEALQSTMRGLEVELETARSLLAIGDLSDVPLSAVSVDQMLNF